MDLLAWPAPRVGLLWSAGVAAALPFEVQELSSRFHASAAQVAGEYRRPLDPPEAQVGRVLGIGWRPLGERGAVAGKVDVGREWLRPASVALGLESYGGTPFLPTDTAHPDVARTRVTLEGAGGYRLGSRWAGGIALGYAALDSRTNRTALPRTGRAVSSSAALSIVRSIPSAGLTVAGYVRRSRWTEQASVREQAARDLVFELQGFSEPEPVSFSVGYSRRMERDEHGYGIGMAGHALGTTWSAFGELRDSDEGHSSQFSNDPPTDRWIVSGYALGAAAARSVGERVAITARA
ncbi:MAG TPA: hypothetical protein VMM35_12580, partial [Longimicrobiales bacterium]|nr:hypothetical protein [Longimicrobiales bacterium]